MRGKWATTAAATPPKHGSHRLCTGSLVPELYRIFLLIAGANKWKRQSGAFEAWQSSFYEKKSLRDLTSSSCLRGDAVSQPRRGNIYIAPLSLRKTSRAERGDCFSVSRSLSPIFSSPFGVFVFHLAVTDRDVCFILARTTVLLCVCSTVKPHLTHLVGACLLITLTVVDVSAP